MELEVNTELVQTFSAPRVSKLLIHPLNFLKIYHTSISNQDIRLCPAL